MRRRAVVAGIGSFLAQPWAASAVLPVRRHRVGFLDTSPRERNVNFAVFQQVLLERGYAEGQNLTFGYRLASGRNASFAELASEAPPRSCLRAFSTLFPGRNSDDGTP